MEAPQFIQEEDALSEGMHISAHQAIKDSFLLLNIRAFNSHSPTC